MGYYHVNRVGSGIYLSQVNGTPDVSKIELTQQDIEEVYRQVNGTEHQFNNVDDLTFEERTYLLAKIVNKDYYCFDLQSKAEWEYTKTDIINNLIHDEYFLPVVLGALYCKIHNYPLDAFIGVTDYDLNKMIFCDVIFPLKEGYESLGAMTVEIYKKELDTYFEQLTGEKQDLKIVLCEEYIKE